MKADSPNPADKRAQIIEAAKVVLVRDGLRACTVREVAEESRLARSAIHYYFRSMREVIAAAMDSLFDELVSGLRKVGAGIDDPVDRFWAVMESYVDLFRDEDLVLLWYDWALQSIRDGDHDAVRRVETKIREVLTELVEACGVDDYEARSGALNGYMIGITLRQLIHQASFDTVRDEIASLSGVPARG